ncbi:MAG: metallophosphoesterase family protein [Rhabdochlamydiaceae bacterium]
MRIGVISDIHGNLVALNSVLSELSQHNAVDSIVCLGDVAATGPRPHETLSRIKSANIPIVKGNRDDYLLNIDFNSTPPKNTVDDYSSSIGEIDRWCRTKLTDDDLRYIQSFPETLPMPLGSDFNECLFCFHGSPKSNTDLITSTTPENELILKLMGHKDRIMTGGHSHVQMFRRHGETAIVNPGSVGQAIENIDGSLRVRRVPRAEYAIIECDDQGILRKVEVMRKSLVVSEILQDAISSGMPHAEWWANRK